jgi:hypothetical protein
VKSKPSKPTSADQHKRFVETAHQLECDEDQERFEKKLGKIAKVTGSRYGRGRHRFHPGLLDFARHCSFRPRLCAPYRAQTNGKVERFIRYLRQSFYVPFASRLAQEGLIVDRETANLAAGRWLREVANTRVHGTTGEVPAERLAGERMQLQPVPMPYGGRSVRSLQSRHAGMDAGMTNDIGTITRPVLRASARRGGGKAPHNIAREISTRTGLGRKRLTA